MKSPSRGDDVDATEAVIAVVGAGGAAGVIAASAKAVNEWLCTLRKSRSQMEKDRRDACQQALDVLREQLDAERDDCKGHLSRLEKRLDQCEEKHGEASALLAELAGRIGAQDVARRARSISPPPMPALQRPSGEHPTFGSLDLVRDAHEVDE
jgi:uncharacterized membrane protein YccC